MKKILLVIAIPTLIILGGALLTKSLTRREYAGVEKCRLCHAEQYRIWQKNKHSQATRSLPVDKRKQFKCLRCHGTGSIDPLPEVQCEACHGRGRHYSHDFIMKDKELARAMGFVRKPGEKRCRRCHLPSAPNLKPFDYQAALKVIKHWKSKSYGP